MTAERAHAAVRRRQLIPFLAGHLAGLAPDAHRRIREEPHRLSHQDSPLRARASPAPSSLGGGREERASGARRPSEGGRSPPPRRSTLQTKAFPSWIETLGSATRAVSSLAASPVMRP